MSVQKLSCAVFVVMSLGALLAGCGGDDMTDAEYQAQIAQGMHDSLQTDLQALVTAAKKLQADAPEHAWDHDDPAWATLNQDWIDARHAYEHVEGATAPVFPDIDVSIDGRVEDFGSASAGTLTLQSDMFSDQGMTGLHAVERILYADPTLSYYDGFDTAAAQGAATYEQGLGYAPAPAFPATDAQALEFKTKLCAKLVSDAQALLDGWHPTAPDVGSSYQGLVALMNEQKEKVTLAGLHQEESRYSQRTMDDLRQNLAGTTHIYSLFQPWIVSKDGGADIDAKITAGFDQLKSLYDSDTFQGVAFPQPPDGWSDEDPSQADLQTPFGKLYTAVLGAVDPSKSDSVVSQMNDAAGLTGLPTFTE